MKVSSLVIFTIGVMVSTWIGRDEPIQWWVYFVGVYAVIFDAALIGAEYYLPDDDDDVEADAIGFHNEEREYFQEDEFEEGDHKK